MLELKDGNDFALSYGIEYRCMGKVTETFIHGRCPFFPLQIQLIN